MPARALSRIENPAVAATFAAFPDSIRGDLLALRRLILDTAAAEGHGEDSEETLKWGEPACVSTAGSTIRIGWKVAAPRRYGLYFHCQTRLIETFRELYRDRLEFAGNRAIVPRQDAALPQSELRHCIALALNYHRIKQLPLPGA